MKRVIKASSENTNRIFTAEPSREDFDKLLSLTLDEVVEILRGIIELRGLNIFYEITTGCKIAFYIGENIYTFSKEW